MCGADDLLGEDAVTISPNPASTYITIDAPIGSNYLIYSCSGNPVI
jgi:hypothetical protein